MNDMIDVKKVYISEKTEAGLFDVADGSDIVGNIELKYSTDNIKNLWIDLNGRYNACTEILNRLPDGNEFGVRIYKAYEPHADILLKGYDDCWRVAFAPYIEIYGANSWLYITIMRVNC